MSDAFDNAPTVGWIHNISKNQMKYLDMQIKNFDLGREVRFLMMIHDNPNCSQDDIVNTYGESKANIAKSLKKLEDKNYITRTVNPENRRKYMLNTTPHADELVEKIRTISRDWEREVGIDKCSDDFKQQLKEIALKSMKLTDV